MDRKYPVIGSTRAGAMMLQHIAFLGRVSAPAAQRLSEDFADTVERIAENPLLFPENQDEPGYRSALFSKRYKAIFSIEEDTVYLDAVLDCRMDN